MPEEPDEVFYDWGKIVSEPSEPSEPRKFYDESGKLVDGVFLFCDSEKCCQNLIHMAYKSVKQNTR